MSDKYGKHVFTSGNGIHLVECMKITVITVRIVNYGEILACINRSVLIKKKIEWFLLYGSERHKHDSKHNNVISSGTWDASGGSGFCKGGYFKAELVKHAAMRAR